MHMHCTSSEYFILWLTPYFNVMQHVLPITILLISMILIIIGKQLKLKSYPKYKLHHPLVTSLPLDPNNPISTVFCNTCSLHPAYTHKTRPGLHQIHYNKNVHVTSTRRKVHTISVKWPGDALAAENTDMEEFERHIGMKTEGATSHNGGVTQPVPHCSICMLKCCQWWWACRIQCITGPWNRVKFHVTHV